MTNKYSRPLFTSNDVAENSGGRYNPPADITNQVNVNREDNNAKGMIFYNNSYWQNRDGKNTYFSSSNEGYFTYLPEHHFQHIALWPSISWRRAPKVPEITNLTLDKANNLLSWDCSKKNYRFAIYCYDTTLTQSKGCVPENLLGITYTTEFNTLEFNDRYEGKIWNVKIVDRYGNISNGAKINTDTPQKPTATPTIAAPVLPIYNTKEGIRIELDRRSRISIYNTSGQIVYKKTANGTLNINNLSKGVYIIQIDKQTQKVII